MKFTPSDAPRLVLIDTNILISAIDPREEGRARFVAPIVSALSDAGRVATCAQVVGEFFDSATRANGKIAPVFSRLEGQRFAADLVDAYTYLETTEAVSLSALHASIRYQMRFYDAELWAIARI